MSRPYRHPLSWRSWPFRAVAGLILFTLLVRGVWGWWLGRKAAAELAKIRARGEPVRVEDVGFQRMPDSQNAAVVLKQAMAARVSGTDSPLCSNEDYSHYLPFPPVWHKLAGASEAAHAPLFALVRQARARQGAQFSGQLSSPLVLFMLPHLNPARDMANVVTDGALYMHVQGNDAEAMERLLDVWHIGRSLRQDHWLLSQLVAVGIESLVCESAQIIAPGLRLGPPSTQPVARQQITLLIADLLDEGPACEAIHQTLIRERLSLIDAAEVSTRPLNVLRPFCETTILQTTVNMEIVIRAFSCADWPQAERTLKQHPRDHRAAPDESVAYQYSRVVTDLLEPTFNSSCERHFRILAERRVTAICLAGQLYRLDHAGWPQSLDELVPQYLPAIPRDPYVSGSKPMGYAVLKGVLPGGRDRPVVWYEAGPDSPSAISPSPIYGWQRSKKPQRQYRDLARFDPPPPSTQSVGDDQD